METTVNKAIHVLLAEDDLNLGYLLLENLKAKGLDVTLVQNGKDALDAMNKTIFDICLLDIMMPEIDGFTIARKARELKPSVPFIFLTARAQEKDKLHGFDLGADDYVTKPFSFKELYCRMMVVLRRMNFTTGIDTTKEILYIGDTTLHASKRILQVKGSERKLSQREAGLLAILMQNSGNYVSRSEILTRVWGNDDYFTAKSMDVYVTRIRKLLKEDPTLEIENLYGSGYRIKQNITINQ